MTTAQRLRDDIASYENIVRNLEGCIGQGQRIAEWKKRITNSKEAADDIDALVEMLRICVEGQYGLAGWTDIYPCDYTPRLMADARKLLAKHAAPAGGETAK